MNSYTKFLLLASSALICDAAEPNPPAWDTQRVKIIEPSNPGWGQQTVDAIWNEQGGQGVHGQFSDSRYAVMFKRGAHNVNVKVGFYTQVMGLGDTPQDVTLKSLYCPNGDTDFRIGALDNFWRSVESLQVNGKVTYAVSQAAPMRRMQINGDLDLFKYDYGDAAGFASGGYMGDVVVTGTVNSGSQQQWMSRNSQWGRWSGGVWNMVFSGCNNAPASHCGPHGGGPFTTLPNTPLIAEKPYISENGNNQYFLNIPKVEQNKVGPTKGFRNADTVDFSHVYVANEHATAQTISQKLAEGLHVVLQPGNYYLTDSIKVTKANSVLLGIGMATLVATTGKPCIEVANVDGVRVAGILLEAGETKSDSLLVWGTKGYQGNGGNPGVASDVFARVGGRNDQHQHPAKTNSMITINSGNVIIDNTWLWRADHDKQGLVYSGNNPVASGAVINGDNVIAYGLAAEHTLGHMVEWNGNNGMTVFYQSEFPYDVDASYGQGGFAAYKVNDSVTSHKGYGVGAYSYFRDHDVTVTSGIQAPSKPGITFTNSLSVFLNGRGGITHVINNQGNAVHSGAGQSWQCQYGATEEQEPKDPSEIPFLQ